MLKKGVNRMSEQSTTEETKSSGTSSDHRPEEAKQAAATVPNQRLDEAKAAATTTSDQPPKKIEQAPVATSDSHPEPVQKPRRSLRRFAPLLVLLLAAALLFVITTNWNSWVGRAGTQKTDDAYLRADITPLSTRVSGTVKEVAVEDYQRVKAGDLLVQLKDDDFRAQVEQSEAAVQAANAALENNSKQKALQESRIAEAQAGVEAAKADIAQAEANIEASRAEIATTQAGMEAAKADVV